MSTGLGGWEMERVGVFSATRLRVLWRQAPRPGIVSPREAQSLAPRTGYQPGLPVCPSSLLKGHHRQQSGSGMCHPEPPPVMWSVLPDTDAVPLRDGREASAAWPWRCLRSLVRWGYTPQSAGLPQSPSGGGCFPPHLGAPGTCHAKEVVSVLLEDRCYLCWGPWVLGQTPLPPNSFAVCPRDPGDPLAWERHGACPNHAHCVFSEGLSPCRGPWFAK